MAEISFTKQMRIATRDVHAVSDALVNAKLLFALSNNGVWAEGLVIFYEIFRFLEEAMKRHKNELLGRFLFEGIERTKTLETDIKFYLGENWEKDYEVRNEVSEYLVYLKNLEAEDPDLLMAFVYHLYMGLLSGGQILTRKRQIKDKVMRRYSEAAGYAITDFGENSISSLKKNIRETMDSIAETLDENKRLRLIAESRKVFELNNKIIRTVKGANRAVLELVAFIVSVVIVLYFIYSYWV